MIPIIKTEEENQVALDFVERLMNFDPKPKTKDGRLLTLLAEVIELFEKRYKHTCCDGECNHDDCCGKVKANCPLKNHD